MSSFIGRIILVAAVFAGVMSAAAAADEGSARFKITTKRDNDRVEVKVEGGATILSIDSPFGISEVVVERLGKRWPEQIVLRLHLKGLEHFRISSGETMLESAASLKDGHVEAREWKNGKEDAPLDAKSADWIAIDALDGEGKPANSISPRDGYFRLVLPKSLFAANRNSITVSWIDFYRN